MKYYIGLDNGGTTTKAALFDESGAEISVCSKDTKMIVPHPGFTERDMEEMWQANCDVVKGVIEQSGILPADVLAIAICGHGKGLYLWGKDGKPTRNGIISTDNRAYMYSEKWKADGTEKEASKLSCQQVMACQPVALLAWLKDNEPEAYANIQWVFECKDYVRFRFTGEARAEMTDYSGGNLMNLHTRSFDPELLKLFGIAEMEHALPPLCTSTEICGYVTEEASAKCGLPAGTPVAGGMFDIDACAIAVDVVDEKNICMIAGTWSINEYLRKTPVTADPIPMNSLFCMPEYYLIEECSATSAGNNEWFIKTLLPEFAAQQKQSGKSVYDEMNNWVERIPPSEFCPVFLPFLMASNVHPNAKGSFVGISNYHTRAHLVRSVYEGVAFSHKYHLDKLLKTREQPPGCIRLAGGVARSPVWTQMFADIMQLPVERVSVNETGALGCAIAAAVAVGQYPSLGEAANSMCTILPAVQPQKELAEVYQKKYALYLKVINGLDGVWADMQQFMEEEEA